MLFVFGFKLLGTRSDARSLVHGRRNLVFELAKLAKQGDPRVQQVINAGRHDASECR
jgi:hypothetical protein